MLLIIGFVVDFFSNLLGTTGPVQTSAGRVLLALRCPLL